MSLTGRFSYSSSYDVRETDDTAGSGRDTDDIGVNVSWGSGYDDNEAENAFSRSSDSFSGTSTIDLTAVPNALGTIDAESVVEFIFRNTGGVDLEIGPGASDGWDSLLVDTTIVKPGASVVMVSPLSGEGYVVDATHKNLLIECPTGTGAYELHIKVRTTP